jgi:hypothetical protein
MTPIYQLVDNLPTEGITVRALQSLDFVAPGQWQNLVGFENTIQQVTGETDPPTVSRIRDRANQLYEDTTQGYQRALWIYQTVDKTDRALGSEYVIGNVLGDRIKLFSFLNQVTPKADTTQMIDLSIKLTAELIAFCYINGLPGDSVGEFVQALGAYEKEALIRMAALVAFDGLIPLGSDFVDKALSSFRGFSPSDLEQNATFQRIREAIPGGDSRGQMGFISGSFGAVSDWMRGFMSSHGMNRESVLGSLRNYFEVPDDKLDYLAGFLDMGTKYFEHTGTQSLARSLVLRAVSEI